MVTQSKRPTTRSTFLMARLVRRPFGSNSLSAACSTAGSLDLSDSSHLTGVAANVAETLVIQLVKMRKDELFHIHDGGTHRKIRAINLLVCYTLGWAR